MPWERKGEPLYDDLIIGGGFFGCMLAAHLGDRGRKVVVCEREDQLLQRASYTNQARVHNGYHYPRSILTAVRSRVLFPRFTKDFEACICDDFEKYYGVSRHFSKVNARRYKLFFERIDAPIEIAPQRVRRLFNDELIEEVFSVTEYAFDSEKLRELSQKALDDADVIVRFGTEVTRLDNSQEGYQVKTVKGENEGELFAKRVFNCTYSRLNQVLFESGMELIKLKHELTEIALIEPPDEIKDFGITIMCGPFFSCMPFPPRGLHSLTHVRYTPHCWWYDDHEEQEFRDPYKLFSEAEKKTNFIPMMKDASRYIPCMAEAKYKDSLFEVKTVLPRSEMDDSRPILFQKVADNLFCIMGGKIDNVYDAIAELDNEDQ